MHITTQLPGDQPAFPLGLREGAGGQQPIR